MQLIYKALLATSAIAFGTVAAAQTTPPPSTQPTMPDEPSTTPPATAPGQTQTTTDQTQAAPGEASQTTPAQASQTPSIPTVAATAADLKVGAAVYDQNGDAVGKIKSVSSKGIVVDTGKVTVEVPAKSFAKSDKGLAIGMTKAEIEAAAKKTPPKPK